MPRDLYDSWSHRERWHSISTVSVAAFICCFCTACQKIPAKNGLLEREVTTPHVTAQQLRVLVNEYVVFSAHRLELCADKILAENPEVAVRKSALLWKINGIAAGFQAASRHDPLGAYLDIWVLNRQMLHLFESPKGLELFGIDHFFWRVWQISLVFAFLGASLGWRLVRVRSQLRNSHPTQENISAVGPTTLAIKSAIKRSSAA